MTTSNDQTQNILSKMKKYKELNEQIDRIEKDFKNPDLFNKILYNSDDYKTLLNAMTDDFYPYLQQQIDRIKDVAYPERLKAKYYKKYLDQIQILDYYNEPESDTNPRHSLTEEQALYIDNSLFDNARSHIIYGSIDTPNDITYDQEADILQQLYTQGVYAQAIQLQCANCYDDTFGIIHIAQDSPISEITHNINTLLENGLYCDCCDKDIYEPEHLEPNINSETFRNLFDPMYVKDRGLFSPRIKMLIKPDMTLDNIV